MDLRPLTDESLLCRLDTLVSQERENIADIVEHLMEVDRREIVLDRGFQSLYKYCTEKLGYSEQAALARIRAARAAAEFEEILPRLRSGQLHLDAVIRIYPHLTAENRTQVLNQVENATSREVQGLVANLGGGKTLERDVIRPLPAERPIAPDEVCAPPSRLRLEFTVDDELVEMIEKLRSHLRHKYPFARLEEIFKEAAEALLKKLDPGREPKPAKAATSQKKRSRLVPAAIKRQVWARDGGRCAYVSEDGRRCESRDALEYDHVVPWALGGASDRLDNVRLLCRPHHQRQGRKRFGPRRRPSSGG
jgi:hypothetical protein